MNRRTRRTLGVALGGMLLGGVAAAGAQAQTPALTVKGKGTEAAANAQALVSQAMAAAASAAACSASTLYLAPGASGSSIPGYTGLSTGGRSYVDAMALINSAFRAIGGTSDRQTVLQCNDGKYYVGLDGEGGRWFGSADQAMSFLFNSQVAKDQNLSTATKQSVTTNCNQDIECAVKAVASDPYVTIATIARGTTTDVSITGKGFSNVGGTPTIASGDGILVKSVTFVSSTALTATLQVTQAAALGDNMVAVFNPGSQFRNAGAYRLVVTDGKDSGPNTEAATKAAAAALTVPGTTKGTIVRGADEQYFKITAQQAGTLSLSSTGGSDLKAKLEDSAGAVLATSDDDGTGYNFKLSGTIAPGTYYLRVSHCCGGIGAYEVSASFAATSQAAQR